MSINIFNAMEQFLAASTDMSVFGSDFDDGSFQICPSVFSCLLFDTEKEPISQLCRHPRLHNEDEPMVTAFCVDLCAVSDDRLIDNRYTLNFRMDVSPDCSGDYKWITLVALIQKDLRRVHSVICHMRVMNDAEILTKSIIDSFTNDKHPMVFNNRAVKLIADNPDKHIAFVQFDIEKFKMINTRYGEKKGTEILTFINNGLDSICSNNQMHLRLSADVFMIAMAYDKTDEIERLIHTIEERLSHYGDISYRFAFGVHMVEDKTMPIRKMGDRAAMARQTIKGNALRNVGYYTDSQENSIITRKFIEDRMYYALENGEFVMFLQPKYCISSEKIVGAEALVRWIHPEKGMISPAEFIPVFEQNGFIIKLDEYIWEQACKTVRKWIDSGIEAVPISVNISRIHLTDDSFVDTLDALVEKYNIPKHYIETEITETVETDSSEETIRKLKERGYLLLMDDFGSGYSSLNMLKSTPFDVIKIDREFFSEFMLSDRGKKIIYHTISMSKDIGLELVAEGVETKEQADFLKNCGCDVAQGFLYSRPVPISDFEKKM